MTILHLVAVTLKHLKNMNISELNNTFLCFRECCIRLHNKSPTIDVTMCDIDGELHTVNIPLIKVSKEIYITNPQLTLLE